MRLSGRAEGYKCLGSEFSRSLDVTLITDQHLL